MREFTADKLLITLVWRFDQNASFYLKTPCVPPHLMCYIQQQPIYKQLRVHGYGELASTCMTPASRGYFPRQWTFLGHDLAAARCNSYFYMCAKWLAWRKGRDLFDLLPYYIQLASLIPERSSIHGMIRGHFDLRKIAPKVVQCLWGSGSMQTLIGSFKWGIKCLLRSIGCIVMDPQSW